jgi:hypothetical protein
MSFLKDFASGFLTAGGKYLSDEEQLKRLLAPDEDATTGTPPGNGVFRQNIDKELGGMFGGPGIRRKGFVASKNPALDVANAGNLGNIDLEEIIKLIMSVGK